MRDARWLLKCRWLPVGKEVNFPGIVIGGLYRTKREALVFPCDRLLCRKAGWPAGNGARGKLLAAGEISCSGSTEVKKKRERISRRRDPTLIMASSVVVETRLFPNVSVPCLRVVKGPVLFSWTPRLLPRNAFVYVYIYIYRIEQPCSESRSVRPGDAPPFYQLAREHSTWWKPFSRLFTSSRYKSLMERI